MLASVEEAKHCLKLYGGLGTSVLDVSAAHQCNLCS
jgi:hypothetical protein